MNMPAFTRNNLSVLTMIHVQGNKNYTNYVSITTGFHGLEQRMKTRTTLVPRCGDICYWQHYSFCKQMQDNSYIEAILKNRFKTQLFNVFYTKLYTNSQSSKLRTLIGKD